MYKIWAKIRGDYRRSTIAGIAVVFFFVCSMLVFANTEKTFTWPDETANYYFITEFASRNRLSVPEPLNVIAQNIVHPRSINVYQGNLVPGTFLGFIIIYGLFAKLGGSWLVLFLTPLCAALTGIILYEILRKLFDERIAFISGLLYFMLPPIWYYAQFAMLPNIFFVFLVMSGVFVGMKAVNSLHKNLLLIVAGCLFGCALTVRTNEIIWILCLIAGLWAAGGRQIGLKSGVLFAAGLSLPFVPVLWFQASIYGGAFKTGYQELNTMRALTETVPPQISTSSSAWGIVKLFLIPFGFHPKVALLHVWEYCVALLWWFAAPALIGIFIYLKTYSEKKHAIFLLLFFVVSGFLFQYYGSWVFEDQLTVRLSTVGISYVRYWLPVYMFAIPFVALALNAARNFMQHSRYYLPAMLCAFFLLSLNLVYFQGNDSIVKILGAYAEYRDVRAAVLPIVPENGVIITERGDKIFFPDRAVIGKWTSDAIPAVRALAESGIPVYWYGREQDSDINYLNQSFFVPGGLALAEKQPVYGPSNLYTLQILQ